ncbi:hypothetical protein NDU88_001429, partial [Pleurodeles waltl]
PLWIRSLQPSRSAPHHSINPHRFCLLQRAGFTNPFSYPHKIDIFFAVGIVTLCATL